MFKTTPKYEDIVVAALYFAPGYVVKVGLVEVGLETCSASPTVT